MKVQFVERENGPERLVCEAEIIFEEPGLEGLKLVGFSLWRVRGAKNTVGRSSRSVASEPRTQNSTCSVALR